MTDQPESIDSNADHDESADALPLVAAPLSATPPGATSPGATPHSPIAALAPVDALRRNTEQGVQSVIRYDKQDGHGTSRRVIEPRSIAHGLSGLLVRAMEFEPQQGARHYKSNHIVEVEAHDVPLAEPRADCGEPMPEIPLEPTTGLSGGADEDRDCTVGAMLEPGDGGPLPLEGVSVVPAVPWMLRSPLERAGFNAYLDAVRDAVLDLVIEDNERERLSRIRTERSLTDGHMRAAHARVFAEYVMGYSNDGDIDTVEMEHLAQLRQCLDEVGWCPG